jgi:hypothetical protein
MIDDIKYHILSFFVGIIIKLYDDLYDNDLYDEFGVNKEYTTEILKLSGIVGFTIIALKYSYVYLFFVFTCLPAYFINKYDYGVYEVSGLVSSIIAIPFMKWGESKYIFSNIVSIFVVIVFAYIIEVISNSVKNTEYSDIKLLVRSNFVLGCLSNYCFFPIIDIYSPSLKITLTFWTGYMATSCFFQYFLLTRDKNKGIYDTYGMEEHYINLDETD